MTHTRPHTEAHDAQLAGSAEPRREARAASHEVVVVNRDPELRALLSRALYAADLPSAFVASDQELQACLRNGTRGLVVVSIESGESIELLSRLRRELAEVPLVAVARTATPDLVRDVMRAGATDFLFGSLDSRSLGPRLLALLEAASPASCSPVSPDLAGAGGARSGAARAAVAAGAAEAAPAGDIDIVGSSKAMRRLLEIAERIAPTDSTVLIQGESGTGKELIAMRIHRLSRRADKPFVAVNCGALPESLLESQLFGHEKGSFTGAVHRQVGLFEIADQGTIFLDEIGETSPDMQVKLLRVLQSRELRRIGGSQVVKVDVRVMAATNKDLKQEVEASRFRSDLYYRLNVICLDVPPLRERPEEIPALVESFAQRVAKERGVPQRSFAPEVIEKLQRCRWTGNVRELENAVERLILLAKRPLVEASDLDEHLGASAEASTESPFLPTMSLDDVKRIHIGNVLRQNGGNKMRTARVLKINVKTLYNLMKRLDIRE